LWGRNRSILANNFLVYFIFFCVCLMGGKIGFLIQSKKKKCALFCPPKNNKLWWNKIWHLFFKKRCCFCFWKKKHKTNNWFFVLYCCFFSESACFFFFYFLIWISKFFCQKNFSFLNFGRYCFNLKKTFIVLFYLCKIWQRDRDSTKKKKNKVFFFFLLLLNINLFWVVFFEVKLDFICWLLNFYKFAKKYFFFCFVCCFCFFSFLTLICLNGYVR